MKSQPCAILALLPLILLAGTIESRNEPGEYWRAATNYEPAPDVETIDLDVKTPTKLFYDNFRSAYATSYYDDLQRELLSYVKATPGDATISDVKTRMKPFYNKFMATPYASRYYSDLQRAFLSPGKVTPDVATINDVKTQIKSMYNKFMATPYASRYYDDLKKALLMSPGKVTPDVATINDLKTRMKLLYSKFWATPYASSYYGDVVPKGKNPPAQPSPRNSINRN